MSATRSKLAAVVVTYHYPAEALGTLLDSVAPGLGWIFLIDNNVSPATEIALGNCSVIHHGNKAGLAGALNQGITAALAAGYRYVLFLDQDSRPRPGMIDQLLQAHDRLAAAAGGDNLGAIGATIYDPRQRRDLPFARLSWRGLRPLTPDGRSSAAIPCDLLITSGCLVAASVLEAVGTMDEALFIDDIDVEWCLRARARGYRLFGIPNAILDHRLGDKTVSLPLLKRTVFVHGPERQYHIIRNHLWLLRRRYIPRSWKIQHTAKVAFRLLLFGLVIGPRRRNLRMMLRGLRDGLRAPG